MGKNNQEIISFNLTTFLTPIAVLLSGLMIAAGLFFGLRSSDSPGQDSPSGRTGGGGGEVLPAQGAPPQAPPGNQPPPPNQEAKTSIDDDAVMGNKSTAQIAIVEFSDYECPFCERFASQTLGQIKENYVDTGKAVFVFRDLPLSFHNPAAEREAIAAECAREQGGDGQYFEYHDKIFEASPGNGAGVDLAGLVKLAQEIGLNGDSFKTCLEEERFKDEVAKDASDASKAGISGTPGFVIGKLDENGDVDGTLIRGAQPYSSFEQAIEAQLGS